VIERADHVDLLLQPVLVHEALQHAAQRAVAHHHELRREAAIPQQRERLERDVETLGRGEPAHGEQHGL
jgi:hypothetical protein